ncbi:hypothetical protein C8R43DRAFT_947244 [Mycena crocata]|nr:hypothetical protein C8R43DRAFT_947244 [Mycena crocata]
MRTDCKLRQTGMCNKNSGRSHIEPVKQAIATDDTTVTMQQRTKRHARWRLSKRRARKNGSQSDIHREVAADKVSCRTMHKVCRASKMEDAEPQSGTMHSCRASKREDAHRASKHDDAFLRGVKEGGCAQSLKARQCNWQSIKEGGCRASKLDDAFSQSVKEGGCKQSLKRDDAFLQSIKEWRYISVECQRGTRQGQNYKDALWQTVPAAVHKQYPEQGAAGYAQTSP